MIADAGFEVGEMRESGARTDLWGGIASTHKESKCERRATNIPFFWIAVLHVWRGACLQGSAIRLTQPGLASPHFSSARPCHYCHATMPPSDPAMLPANADLATTWAYLKEGIDPIMRGESGSTGGIPSEYV